MAKFTVLKSNEMLGTSNFVGVFDDLVTAQAYINVEAWTGTPKAPGKPVAGTLARGKK